MAVKKRQLIYDYDPKSDELNMVFGKNEASIAEEIDDDFFVQLDPKTREVLGFTVLGFRKRLSAARPAANKFALPIEFQGQMQLAY